MNSRNKKKVLVCLEEVLMMKEETKRHLIFRENFND